MNQLNVEEGRVSVNASCLKKLPKLSEWCCDYSADGHWKGVCVGDCGSGSSTSDSVHTIVYFWIYVKLSPPKSTPPLFIVQVALFERIMTTSAFLSTSVIYFIDSAVSKCVILKKKRNGLP